MPKNSQNRDEAAMARAKRIGDFLRQRREERGLNKVQLAEIAGCDRGTVRNAESAKVHILEENLTNIFDALEVSAAERARLFETGLAVGSVELRLKTILMKAIVLGHFGGEEDSRPLIEQIDALTDPELEALAYSRSQRDRVIQSLENDGLLVRASDGVLSPRLPTLVLDFHILHEYSFHVRDVVTSLLRYQPDDLNLAIEEASRIISSSLTHTDTEPFYNALEYAQLVLCGKNALLAEMTTQYVRVLRRFHAIALGLIAPEQREDFSNRFQFGITSFMHVVLARHAVRCQNWVQENMPEQEDESIALYSDDRRLHQAVKQVEEIVRMFIPDVNSVH